MFDLAGGHGLLAHVMLLLDDSSPRAIVVDTTLPPSHVTLHEALLTTWPRLRGRIEFVEGPIDAVEMLPADLAVSSHACGDLTDRVLECAVSRTRARRGLAVLSRFRDVRCGPPCRMG